MYIQILKKSGLDIIEVEIWIKLFVECQTCSFQTFVTANQGYESIN